MLRLSLKKIAAIFFGIATAFNVSAAIEEGKQYTLMEPPIMVSTADNEVEVLDFFSYGCPHCATLAPYFAQWEATKPANVVVKKVPVEFQPAWETYAKLYYTAAALKIDDKMDPILFNAVQKGEDLTDLDVAAKLFADQGIDAEKFKSTYNSFSVETALNQGRFLAKQYKVSRTPLIVIDGRYQTNLGMAGGPQGLADTLNFLVAKAEKQHKLTQTPTTDTPK